MALTANAVAGSREKLISQGFDDFVEKPIERSVLERVLKRNISVEKITYDIEQAEIIENHIQEEISMEMLEKALAPEGIDVSKGVLYCNGKERYIEILKSYCEDNNELKKQVEELYEKKDWKNYTIAIHGMKSSMRSIGATEISQLAASLERAGLDGNIDFVINNHNAFMGMYIKLFEGLSQYGWLQAKGKRDKFEKEEIQGKIAEEQLKHEAISEEDFNEILSQMEMAMYSLDGDKLKELAYKLCEYEYMGSDLNEALQPAVRKIEMSDYMSAVEMVVNIKGKIKGKEAK